MLHMFVRLFSLFHAGLFARILFWKQTNIVARYNSPLSFLFYSLAFPLFIARYSIFCIHIIYILYKYSILSHSLSLFFAHLHTQPHARAHVYSFVYNFHRRTSYYGTKRGMGVHGNTCIFYRIQTTTSASPFFRYLILTLSLSLSYSLSRTHAQSPIFPCTRRRSCALMNYYL